jgi:hypothetical protein
MKQEETRRATRPMRRRWKFIETTYGKSKIYIEVSVQIPGQLGPVYFAIATLDSLEN